MSIQDSGGPITYSDHDVHHVSHEVKSQAAGTNTASITSSEDFEITQRGLDPDELAELRAMIVDVGVVFDSEAAEDSIGSFNFAVGAGYNTDGDDYPFTSRTQELFDTDDDGTNDFQVLTKDTDEVGHLFTFQDTMTVPYDDDTNGNGAGGISFHERAVLNAPELFGTGPVVDSADDFNSTVRLFKTNSEAAAGIAVNYSLYYAVEEQEGGRTRFGR